MKILVTGGLGYIGSTLVPELVKEGHKVTVVDLGWFGNTLPEDIDCTVLRKDFCTLQKESLKGYEAIIHLAGLTNDPMAEYDPWKNYVVNAAGTAHLAQAAKEAEVLRFIYASTCSVYGFVQDKKFSTEEDEPTPQYPYGISKLMAERALLALMDSYFGIVIFRKGTVGGYSPRMRYDLVVNTMTMHALKTGKLEVRNASLWRPLINIQDIVEGYKLALKEESWGIFNLVERNYTIKQLGEEVANAIEESGKPKPQVVAYDRFDLRNYKASGQKAKDYLGFSPEFSVKDTVWEILKKVDEGEIADFENPNYYNIEVMRKLQ